MQPSATSSEPTTLIVDDRWWKLIDTGEKKIEGRKDSPTWARLKVGDKLCLVNKTTGSTIEVKIVSMRYKYGRVINEKTGEVLSPLEHFLIQEGLRNVLPGVTTLSEAVSVYREYWTDAEIEKWGMRAIELVKVC